MYKRKRSTLGGGSNVDVIPVDQQDKEWGNAAEMDDALVALEVLRSQFPASASRPHPVAFVSQIYSLVPDRTDVDRSLARACKNHRVRMFLAPGSSTEMMLQHIDDYIESITDSMLQAGASGRDQAGESNRKPGQRRGEVLIEAEDVLRRFKGKVLPKCTGLYVSRVELSRLLNIEGRPRQPDEVEEGEDDWSISPADTKAVDLLVRGGALASRDAHSMWFTPVRCGMLLAEAGKGRDELMGILGRYKFGEVLLRELCRKRLKTSTLGAKFIVRDLVGRGLLEIKETTAGPMVKALQAGARR